MTSGWQFQHSPVFGSHPHSPGCCVRRSIIFTALRICQTFTLGSVLIAILMMQLLTYFWRFRQCQLNFMPFASALHAAVAFSRATLSALDSFAAAARVGTNAIPLTSTVAIMPAIKVVAKRYMIPSFELMRSLELFRGRTPNRREHAQIVRGNAAFIS